MKSDQIKLAIPTEADLCAIFMRQFNDIAGWTCYPETSGFDILVVHESGRQIGVEAKLQLNAKVADQVLPGQSWYGWQTKGPDHRLVIVRNITDANAGIAKMLDQLGVHVWAPWIGESNRRSSDGGYESYVKTEFQIQSRLQRDDLCSGTPASYRSQLALFDWNPSERMDVPDAVPALMAGIPAPIRMTPWKQAAVRVLARLRTQGQITTKEITLEGCSPSIWTQKWLDRSEVRGQWVESDRMPALDRQHPELYALAEAAAIKAQQQSREA